ncbi:MAG: right-handed parallel beta-helix repeat-containing protein [Planctomycetota bacterium]|nr:right-handed parallel beta-helix repeat-containing protein [Planctomycetota bacterium]
MKFDLLTRSTTYAALATLATVLVVLVGATSINAQQPGSPVSRGAVAPLAASLAGNHHYLSKFKDAGNGRLDRAIQVLGSHPAVLLVDIADGLGRDITVPSNVELVHFGSSQLDLNGHLLNVQGSFLGGQSWLFTGGGTVTFSPGSVGRVVPQWWGANTSASVQKALDAAAECGAELFLPAGTYVFDTKVEFLFSELGFDSRALTIRGAGPGRTVIDNQSAGEPSFSFRTADPASQWGWFLTVEGLDLTSSTGTGSAGIEARDIWIGRIADCRVADHAGDGILLLAELNDYATPKTWTIERSLIVQNGGYGIRLDSVTNELPYMVLLDQLDVELNAEGGIYAASEQLKVTNSIFAYNGSGPTSKGGVYVTGITGFTPYGNLIEGCAFEGNRPYSVYADRAANLTIARNEFSRVLQFGVPQPDDYFIRLDGPQGVDNAIIEHNQFGSGVQGPFTAIVGGPGLRNADLDNNVFNLNFAAGDTRFVFAQGTPSTYRAFGDTVLTNQSISFADPGTGNADVVLDRGGPGMLLVTGGVVDGFQVVQAFRDSLSVDCSLGLTALHTLSDNTVVLPPVNATTGAVLNLLMYQGSNNYAVSFDPIFKSTGLFSVNPLTFSTIQFVYTGLYWVQLGEAALSAPL